MLCLPKELTNKFLGGLKDGSINPQDLSKMTSAERHALFEGFVGKENAKDVNALFESKMLLKDQQAGMIQWAKETAGMNPEVQRDIISRINKLETALNPEDQESFLHDLVAKKLGTEVTSEEAKQISTLAKQASEAKAERNTNPSNENILKYGKSKAALGDYMDSVKPSPEGSLKTVKGIKNLAVNILNIPKSALTSVLHFSAMGVQGWGMISTGRFWEATGEQFKYFANEENYKNAQAMISGHPDYDLARSAGLGITSIDGKLNDREEAIQSSLLQKGSKYLSDKTGLPDLLRSSSRAFTGFLNYTRFYRFVDLLNAARLSGEDVSKGSNVPKDIANVVNNFTGRGSLPLGLNNITPTLNAIFFSPRKIAATMEMFNPVEYLNPEISSTARRAALRQLTGSLLVTSSVLGLSRLAGAKFGVNPIGSDFGKVTIGNTSFDMTGGNSAYARLVAQLITGKEKTSAGTTKLGGILMAKSKTGKIVKTPFTVPTRADKVGSYLRDHLAPVAAAVADWMSGGKNVVGQPVTVKSELRDTLTPIVLQDYWNMFKNDPHNAAAILPSLSAIFGVAMQSNPPPKKK